MFHYSFSTVFIAIITSNILIVLLTIFFRNSKVMVNIGYKLLALFIGFTALRFLLPFELPFTVTVLLPTRISRVIAWFRHPIFEIANIGISVWTIFEGIWIIGVLIHLIHYIRLHAKFRYFILANSLDATTSEPYHSVLDRICRERNRKNRFRVLTVTGIHTPMIYGIFIPRILIPENMQMTQDELYYVLVHETSHHFHHDLLIKNAVKLLSIVYWWNPACSSLIHQTNIVLEMRVDNVLAASNEHATANYLHCLYDIAERAVYDNDQTKMVTMSLLPEADGDLTKRYHMLMSVGQKSNRGINIILFALMAGIYIMSHLFIFEAHYVSPEMAGSSEGQTDNNTYAILKEDGTYDIYYKGMFIENVDSLTYYDSGISVYTETEINNEKH